MAIRATTTSGGTLAAPFIALPISSGIPKEQQALTERTRERLSKEDKAAGIALLAEAYCEVIDAVFTRLLQTAEQQKPSKVIEESLAAVEDVKAKVRHYLGWVAAFLSDERVIKVIHYYNELTTQTRLHGDEHDHAYVVFKISNALSERATATVDALVDGSSKDIKAGAELLIEVLDEGVQSLVLAPKDLMKFNFIVNKTLGGVITVVTGVVHHLIRKFAAHLDEEQFPLVAGYLGQFTVRE